MRAWYRTCENIIIATSPFSLDDRNQPRKDIPATIFGFIEAKKIWPESLPKPFLYLHMHPKDPLGWDLRAIMSQTNLIEGIDYKLLPQKYEKEMVGIHTLNQIYNSADLFITTTLAEGWGLCLASDSIVLTSNGGVEIKDVNVGDSVMTNSGVFGKVVDTTSRKVHSYIEIKTKYGYTIKATHEHPYWSLKKGEKEGWRKIGELQNGDYLAVVKPKALDKDVNNCFCKNNTIDLLEYLTISKDSKLWYWDEKYITNKFGYSPHSKQWSISTICKKYSTTKGLTENAIKYIVGINKNPSKSALELATKLLKDGFKKVKPLSINRYIKISEEVLYVFGWYLAGIS